MSGWRWFYRRAQLCRNFTTVSRLFVWGIYMQSKSDNAKLNRELRTKLVHAGERLPKSVCAQIIDHGSEAIPELIEILKDAKLALFDAPGGGYAPIHAASILQEMKAVDAIEPMLQVLSRCDAMDILYSTLIHALQSFGTSVLESALRAYAVAENEDQRSAIASVLSGIHVHDPRIFSVLLQQLEEDTELGAGDFAEYGDQAALPYLSSALDACKLDRRGGMFANQEIIELAAAIKELGGELTECQASLVRAATGAPKKLGTIALPLRSLSLPLVGSL
jgi:hypothetical protein